MPTYRVVYRRHSHGDLFEIEVDEVYEVVDEHGAVVRRYEASSSGRYEGGPDWAMEGTSGVTSVELTEDGRAVRVRRGGVETIEPLP